MKDLDYRDYEKGQERAKLRYAINDPSTPEDEREKLSELYKRVNEDLILISIPIDFSSEVD